MCIRDRNKCEGTVKEIQIFYTKLSTVDNKTIVIPNGALAVSYTHLDVYKRQFSQSMAEEVAQEEELIFLCGHYEGIDERVLEEIVTDYVSIGDYVLTGDVVASLGEDSGYVPYTAFSAKKSYIKKNKEVIQGFTDALQKGMDYRVF